MQIPVGARDAGVPEVRHQGDLGCGHGRLTRAYAPAHAELVVGVDFSRYALEAARPDEDLSASLVQGDMRVLPFRDGAFNLVIANDSLHLVANVTQVLAEARRVLSPGGTLIASLYEYGTSDGTSRPADWWRRELANSGWCIETWDDVTEEWRLTMHARHQWRWNHRWALLRELGVRAVAYCSVSQRMIGADGAPSFVDLNHRWEIVAVPA
jgi:SAM-dependent methyltransferase